MRTMDVICDDLISTTVIHLVLH